MKQWALHIAARAGKRNPDRYAFGRRNLWYPLVKLLLSSSLLVGLCSSWTLWAQEAGAPPRQVIEVIGTTPLGGAGIDRNKIPGMVESVTADAFESTHSVSPLDTLEERIP